MDERHPPAVSRRGDMPLILDLVRAMPLSCRHAIDLPWRLNSLAIAKGRDAAYWENIELIGVPPSLQRTGLARAP
ncbi:MAG TPA: hypothetical protein VIC27_06635, partial [Ktedonobacterales bacterium]